MKQQLTQILGLKGVIVKSHKVVEQSIILEVEKESKIAFCPRCYQKSRRLHQKT
ncbi:MAG: hypothetical protein IM504_00265 [Microcystis sp. M038S2]|jgi:transposase|uniref:Transposase n=1 Tax=Microcystis aeruginosa G11-04 TaxID=2685956 RepID=A0A966FX05_MICAE|nr:MULTISPECIES: hypothetical protein [unclassified Microcystis]MCA2950799.1 hypothetical protein [Microcystis sp. M112S1]NCS56074.1 hypothetical protein [Microcystis aeruginosa G11-04]NCT42863.1 hypothetical protein [Microcystis aeruginosa G11-09]MCA2684469.1 hypothetical protein [Microcystis sp. M046S2]MCA2703415.1 hypothetical protein [Microcystis sp. M038S2]